MFALTDTGVTPNYEDRMADLGSTVVARSNHSYKPSFSGTQHTRKRISGSYTKNPGVKYPGYTLRPDHGADFLRALIPPGLVARFQDPRKTAWTVDSTASHGCGLSRDLSY